MKTKFEEMKRIKEEIRDMIKNNDLLAVLINIGYSSDDFVDDMRLHSTKKLDTETVGNVLEYINKHMRNTAETYIFRFMMINNINSVWDTRP